MMSMGPGLQHACEKMPAGHGGYDDGGRLRSTSERWLLRERSAATRNLNSRSGEGVTSSSVTRVPWGCNFGRQFLDQRIAERPEANRYYDKSAWTTNNIATVVLLKPATRIDMVVAQVVT